MIVIVCVDDHSGMLFNGRRQSQDSALRKRVLELSKGKRLWMSLYSEKQFLAENATNICSATDFLEQADFDEYCFVEAESLADFLPKIEGMIVYRWNRSYPADVYFDVTLDDYHMVSTSDFIGTSHEKITEEVYER